MKNGQIWRSYSDGRTHEEMDRYGAVTRTDGHMKNGQIWRSYSDGRTHEEMDMAQLFRWTDI